MIEGFSNLGTFKAVLTTIGIISFVWFLFSRVNATARDLGEIIVTSIGRMFKGTIGLVIKILGKIGDLTVGGGLKFAKAITIGVFKLTGKVTSKIVDKLATGIFVALVLYVLGGSAIGVGNGNTGNRYDTTVNAIFLGSKIKYSPDMSQIGYKDNDTGNTVYVKGNIKNHCGDSESTKCAFEDIDRYKMVEYIRENTTDAIVPSLFSGLVPDKIFEGFKD